MEYLVFLYILLGLYLLSVLVQLYFYLFRFFKVVRFKSKKGEVTGGEKVSVIVTAHNEAENLKKIMPALMAQNYPGFEVVVVDDRSTDETEAILLEAKSAYSNLKVIHIENTPPHVTSKKYALTMGIKHASNDLLVLTDADCVPASNEWIQQMAAPLQGGQKKIVLGFSQYTKKRQLLNAFIRFETLLTGLLYISAALAGRPYMGVGRNLAYRKSFFLEKKGFIKHRGIVGGDDDLFVNYNANTQNTDVQIGLAELVLSEPKATLKGWYRQKLRHLVVGKHYRPSSKFGLGTFNFAYILFWVTFCALLALWFEPYIVLASFIVRTSIFYYLLFSGSKRLGDKVGYWFMPVLDVLYVFYLIFVGTIAIFSNSSNTKWK